jgi:hypothetical protein
MLYHVRSRPYKKLWMKSLYLVWSGEGGGGDDGKGKPPTKFLSTVENINTVKKYLTKFDVNDNIMAALSSIGNKVYRVQQKAKKYELT